MNIMPITDFRNTNRIIDICNSTTEPIFITKNGYGCMVLMNLKTYERHEEEKLMLERLVNMNKEYLIDGEEALLILKNHHEI